MEVDFAGQTFSMTDPLTGEIMTIVVFVAILPYSHVCRKHSVWTAFCWFKSPDTFLKISSSPSIRKTAFLSSFRNISLTSSKDPQFLLTEDARSFSQKSRQSVISVICFSSFCELSRYLYRIKPSCRCRDTLKNAVPPVQADFLYSRLCTW